MCAIPDSRIGDIMRERGLKPFPFAKKIGIPSSTMTSIYKGKVQIKNIGIENFLKIAHGLGMTAEELYYGTKPNESPRATYTDSRQRDINEAFEGVTEDGKHAMWTNAVMARTTFPDEIEQAKLQEAG